MEVIRTEGLTKRFGAVTALDGVDLHVRRGEVHGFLGPNGAGKSTTIRVLLGLLRPDSGSARVLDGEPWADAAKIHQRLSYVPGEVSLWPNLTGGEALDVFARLRGGFDQARRDSLVRRFDLDLTRKGNTYSKGNRQKVAIVAALASNVDLLILDEPTAGLDPLMEEVFQQCIQEERDQGRSVLLSSHTLSQVERLCDRVSIIRQGRIVDAGDLAELRHLSRLTVSATLRRPIDPTGLSGVHNLDQDGTALSFEVEPERLNDVMGEMVRGEILSLISRPASLEQIFMQHYRDDVTRDAVDEASPTPEHKRRWGKKRRGTR